MCGAGVGERGVAPVDETSSPLAFSKQQMGAAASKLVSASIGDIAVVFSRSESHKHFTFADIQTMVVPPVLLGQFYVAELAHKENGARAPVAAVTWAHVSAEVDQRLRAQRDDRVKLEPIEWNCGEITWIMDVAGEAQAVVQALGALSRTKFNNQKVSLWTVSSTGSKCVLQLDEVFLKPVGEVPAR
jgi:hemolysin-activating ACP:hemolysin acyltransferase